MEKRDISLSNDLNLVKEFEELKLKQKLLVESLSRKNKSELNSFLLDINSKLDFLVKIFKESQESEDEENTDLVSLFDSKFKSLEEKLKSISTLIEEKFSNLDSKLNNINLLIGKNETIFEEKISSFSNLVPKPDFKIKDDGNEKKEDLKNNIKSKKKGWF